MQNFTGSWARAAGQPMPKPQAPVGHTGAGDGSGGGQMIGSLRPKPNPQAGLNEPAKPAGLDIQNIIYRLFGGQGGIPKAKPKAAVPAPAPAAGLSTPDRMDRASKLLSIGAGLMD